MGIIKAITGKRLSRALAACAAAGLLATLPASALPEGPNVSHGNVTITGSGQNMTIQQATQQAIINWNGFSIGAGEAVRFLQPSVAAAILNRVTGVDPSVINGVLSGNGNVFLINPNGVLIGPGGMVNAGGFLASTLNVSDADFLSGNMAFSQAPGMDLAAVVNQGQIKVNDGGFVVLLAPSISNEGLILARGGEVKLGAGTEATVNFDGQNLIHFASSMSAGDGTLVMSRADANSVLAQAVSDAGVEEAGSLSNSGTIDAGNVLLQAAGDIDLPGVTVNRTGDYVLDTAGNVTIGSYFALDGHSIDIDAGGNITFDTLVAEAQGGQGGLVSLVADGSEGIRGTATGSGIAADLVYLEATAGSISTAVAANGVSALAPNGSIALTIQPGLIDPGTSTGTGHDDGGVTMGQTGTTTTGTLVGTNGTHIYASAGGDVSVNSVNTLYVDQISGRNVSVTSQTGSIVDDGDQTGRGEVDIIATQSASLTAADFIGTIDDPLEVQIGGDLDVLAGREVDGISGVLVGSVGGEYRQNEATAGIVLLNPGNGFGDGLAQAQRGIMDNQLPGDDLLGGNNVTNLFYLRLINSVEEEDWLEILRGSVVWEDSEEEATDL